jgi:hypothetical protein
MLVFFARPLQSNSPLAAGSVSLINEEVFSNPPHGFFQFLQSSHHQQIAHPAGF